LILEIIVAAFGGNEQERENPREIEGRQALFVVNLDQRKNEGRGLRRNAVDIGYADGITPAWRCLTKRPTEQSRMSLIGPEMD